MFKKKKAVQERQKCTCIVAAAGASARMGGDKLLLDIEGMPALIRSLFALQNSSMIDEIIVVTREESIPVIAELAKEYGVGKLRLLCRGGKTRQESVMEGLARMHEDQGFTAIHDGARPLIHPEDIDRVVACAMQFGAAALAVPVKDTIKIAREDEIAGTLPRETLWAVQTPQVFRTEWIRAAYNRAASEKIQLTDDCSAVERLGKTIKLVRGSYSNIKLTTPEDTLLARLLVQMGGEDVEAEGGEHYEDRSRL